MTWKPNPTVTVNGTDYTSQSLWNVNIFYGRNTVWDQPRSGYATIEILNLNDSSFLFEVNQEVIVKMENSVGTPIIVFTGIVSAISNRMVSVGDSGQVGIQTLTALGPFASMARKVIGTTAYPKEYDDFRLDRIFTEAGVTIAEVDTPGIYELTARAASPSDAYTLAAYYAQMSLGYIYETTDNKVGYANESHRLLDVAANGYFIIPLSYILSNGVASDRSFNNITNSIVLSYKANAEKTASDTTSIASYGLQAGNIVTELENASEAQYQVDRYLILRSIPNTNLSSFTIPLDSSAVTSADLDKLINVYMGKPIEILDLPNAILNGAYKGFVEGWQLAINRFQAALTLNTTDFALSIPPTRWQDVSATLIWTAVDPTVQWIDYE